MQRILSALGNVRIAVIGDYILDKYIFGSVKRISPEAPIPVLLQNATKSVLGGAGNVVGNIASLGATPLPLGFLSASPTGDELCALLEATDIDTSGLMRSPEWVTPIKTRFISDKQQILRLDDEHPRNPSDAEREWLLAAAQNVQCDIVILSDYSKGVLAGGVAQALISVFRQRNIPVIVDPKGFDYTRYAGATAVTPNLKELSDVAGVSLNSEEEIVLAARSLITELNLDFVLATRGEEGLSVVLPERELHMPTRAKDVFDVSGAGDTLIASFALAFASGLSLEDSSHLANAAAGVVVGKTGTAMVTRSELEQALGEVQGGQGGVVAPSAGIAKRVVRQWQSEGRTIGFTNGCFDILHPGHVSLLEQAAATCDRLIVGLNSDASVRRLKGPSRPVTDQDSRARMLAALRPVDLVVLFEEDTPLELIQELLPDVLVKGSDYEENAIVGAEIVKANGGRIVRAVLVDGKSTSHIIRRIESTSLEKNHGKP